MHPLIPFHIAAGSAALIAGFAALALAKGSPAHARAGTVFFLTMLAMAGSGTVVALAMPERGTATVGVFSGYLVATSWQAARNRSGAAGAFEAAGFAVALACTASFLAIGLLGLAEPDGRLDLLPAPVHFPFAALAALAAALDLNFLLRRRLAPRARIARHLWRMGTALLIAAFSFFVGQADELPDAVRGASLYFAPPAVVLAAMLFWIVRVRFAKAFLPVRRRTPSYGSALAPEQG